MFIINMLGFYDNNRRRYLFLISFGAWDQIKSKKSIFIYLPEFHKIFYLKCILIPRTHVQNSYFLPFIDTLKEIRDKRKQSDLDKRISNALRSTEKLHNQRSVLIFGTNKFIASHLCLPFSSWYNWKRMEVYTLSRFIWQ